MDVIIPTVSRDLWHNIYLHVDDNDYNQIKLVCSSWRDNLTHQILWKNRCLKKWGEDIVPNKIEASNVTGTLSYDKSRYFIPSISDSNGRLKIDWIRYYAIRSKLEWVINNLGYDDEKPDTRKESVELDLKTFDLQRFLRENLPPAQNGYDEQMNQTIYLLLDLISLFYSNPRENTWFSVTRVVDSYMHCFVANSPTRLLEAHWRLCQSAFENSMHEEAKRSAFSLLHAFCYGVRDFNPRVLNVFRQVITKMIDIGQDGENPIVSMVPLVLPGCEKQIRKRNEKGFLELHEILFNIASERFYCKDSTTTIRVNALSALYLTGAPLIPSYIKRAIDLLLEGMKSTERTIVQKSFHLICSLAAKGHKLTAEQTRTLVEMAILREADMILVPAFVCHAINRETSHVINDKQLDWLNRMELLKRADDLSFIRNESLVKLKAAFGTRMDKYVPQYRELLLNQDYWRTVEQQEPTLTPPVLVYQYLKLVEPQSQGDSGPEFTDLLNDALDGGLEFQFSAADVVFTYFPMLNQAFPANEDENLKLWNTVIEAILSLFSDEMKRLGAARLLWQYPDSYGIFNHNEVTLLRKEIPTRSEADKVVIERVLEIQSFEDNVDPIPLSTECETDLNMNAIEREVDDNAEILIPGIIILFKLAKQMKRSFDPFILDTMHASVGMARFLTKHPIGEASYQFIGEFFSEIFVPFVSEQNSIRIAFKLLNILSLDNEQRILVRSDQFLEGIQGLTENLFMSLIMNSKVGSPILSPVFRHLGNWPSERVPLLFDTLIRTRPSLAYNSLAESQRELYGFAAWIEKFKDDEIALKTYVVIATRCGISFANEPETRMMCLELRNKSTDKYIIRSLNKMIILLSCCIVDNEIEQFNQLRLQMDLKSTKGKEHKEILKEQTQYGSMIESALKSSQFDTTCAELNEMVNKSDKSFAFFLSLDNDLSYN